MGDPVRQWNREFDNEAIRQERIEVKALEITERGMKELDSADVQTTLHRIKDDDYLLASIAECVRTRNQSRLFATLIEQLENDLYLFAKTEATREIDNGC